MTTTPTERDERRERIKAQVLKIIEAWKSSWMNQTQNSEEDRQNYFRRAFGVDANMKHDLARRIAQSMDVLRTPDANPPSAPRLSERDWEELERFKKLDKDFDLGLSGLIALVEKLGGVK